MSDTNRDQNEAIPSGGDEKTEPGFLHIEERSNDTAPGIPLSPPQDLTDVKPATPPISQGQERAGAVEHLAVQRPQPELDTSTPEMKQRLSVLRAECTRLVTGLRWEGLSVEETAERMIPLLNVGPVEQWKETLIPFLYEIDRAGALLPVWLYIIERGDAPDLPGNANPAETMQGRARRFAILMLGNYRMMGIAGLGRSSSPKARAQGEARNLAEILGDLSADPNTSLYATQSLVKHATVPAIQELIRALKYSKGWARVDVVVSCLELKQEQFYDLLVVSGLEDAPGLESYIATPIYRTIPLEKYLSAEDTVSTRLVQQAALMFSQVLQDSSNPPGSLSEKDTLPVVFERNLPTLAQALFAGARRKPLWQNVIALHRLGLLLGRYWQEISQGRLKDVRIVEPVYHCLPMMNDVEYWIRNEGRDILIRALSHPEETNQTSIIKVLGEMRESRAIAPLINRLESISKLGDRQHALIIGVMCETLGQLVAEGTKANGSIDSAPEEHAVISCLQQLLQNAVHPEKRQERARRQDALPLGDPDVPGSIVYAAIVRAAGHSGNRESLDIVYPAARDFDSYVRAQALKAIKRLDPQGEDARSEAAIREASNEPHNSLV